MTITITAIVFVSAFPRLYGEWMLWHSTVPALPDNRVIIHLYPDNQITLKYRFTKGPFVFHKSKTGIYKMFKHEEENKSKRVEVLFRHSEEKFLSAYGIGLQDFNIQTAKKTTAIRYVFSVSIVGNDDIYLKTEHNNDCFHIVRSTRINEPSVDIPISTFLITQVLATILGHVINELLFHSTS